MIEPFETKETLDTSNLIYNSLNAKKKTNYTIIIVLSIMIISVLVLGIVVMEISESNFEDNKIEILCEYDISEKGEEIYILSEKVKIKSDISIYVENELVSYDVKYTFNKEGKYNVKYVFNEILKMENMFENVNNLISVNISHKKKVNLVIVYLMLFQAVLIYKNFILILI